jgi:hypothetical protein
MPRKPAVPSIPDKPIGRTRPERPRVEPKHRPDGGPEQFDMWGAFTASFEQDKAPEASPPPPRAKARPRRGSRTS